MYPYIAMKLEFDLKYNVQNKFNLKSRIIKIFLTGRTQTHTIERNN